MIRRVSPALNTSSVVKGETDQSADPNESISTDMENRKCNETSNFDHHQVMDQSVATDEIKTEESPEIVNDEKKVLPDRPMSEVEDEKMDSSPINPDTTGAIPENEPEVKHQACSDQQQDLEGKQMIGLNSLTDSNINTDSINIVNNINTVNNAVASQIRVVACTACSEMFPNKLVLIQHYKMNHVNQSNIINNTNNSNGL